MRLHPGSASLLIALLFLAACTVPGSSMSEPSTSFSPSAGKVRKLEDWKIRAGLYSAHHAPAVLDYVSDASIDSREYTGQCQDALHELQPYTRGLLRAPTARLRKDGNRIHRANVSYLRACVRGRAVAWHHGKAAWIVTTNQANLNYARAMGANPTAYDAPKVFP